MEKKTEFYLIQSFTGELICKGTNLNEVVKPALAIASTGNYGIYRCWCEDNRLYIDAGPKVFYVIADTLEGVEILKNRMKGDK